MLEKFGRPRSCGFKDSDLCYTVCFPCLPSAALRRWLALALPTLLMGAVRPEVYEMQPGDSSRA